MRVGGSGMQMGEVANEDQTGQPGVKITLDKVERAHEIVRPLLLRISLAKQQGTPSHQSYDSILSCHQSITRSQVKQISATKLRILLSSTHRSCFNDFYSLHQRFILLSQFRVTYAAQIDRSHN